MSAWAQEYLAALTARDEREKAHQEVYDAYTRLADRISQNHQTIPLEAGEIAGQKPSPSSSSTSLTPTLPPNNPMREELSKAQKSRLHLQQQLQAATTETTTLKQTISANEARIASLLRDRTVLSRRLKDREEELKMKARLLDDVQTEVVSLDLQLNMVEEKARRLQGENEELVRRWMERVRVEAESMNMNLH